MKRYDTFVFKKYPDVKVATMHHDDGHISIEIRGENQEHVRAVMAELEKIEAVREGVRTESVIP